MVLTPLPSYYDSLGRSVTIVYPDNTSLTNTYYLTGELKLVSGSRTYPVAYGYDYQGRLNKMTNWNSYGSSATERVTTWAKGFWGQVSIFNISEVQLGSRLDIRHMV